MSITFLLAQPFAQHALLAAALVAVSCGLIGPFVVRIWRSVPVLRGSMAGGGGTLGSRTAPA